MRRIWSVLAIVLLSAVAQVASAEPDCSKRDWTTGNGLRCTQIYNDFNRAQLATYLPKNITFGGGSTFDSGRDGVMQDPSIKGDCTDGKLSGEGRATGFGEWRWRVCYAAPTGRIAAITHYNEGRWETWVAFDISLPDNPPQYQSPDAQQYFASASGQPTPPAGTAAPAEKGLNKGVERGVSGGVSGVIKKGIRGIFK